MRIGYPCINRSIGCTANTTFRLASYSEQNLIEKVTNNLNCLEKILEYNVKKDLLFFRISSDLVPFASHPICKFKWQKHFRDRFKEIGAFIKKYKMRISMHPDQFVLLNAINKDIVKKSIKDLIYHCQILDLLGLDSTAKVQIHIGGVYGDKISAIERFVNEYQKLPEEIKRRLVIENDHISYSLKDCLTINKQIGIPVLFDSFHHECLNNGETIKGATKIAGKTWHKKDGYLMIDYSSQKPKARKGTHTEYIKISHFYEFIRGTKHIKFDLMLEIKDKEKSALLARNIIRKIYIKK
ncbi:MAG: UV DNA damage repair endonuclease UvsE [Candidatus Latescibacteria bacterium]|nr:UV DNA damage repair endonuclease UvsE [Candidatus Latescibacterota bacterium]